MVKLTKERIQRNAVRVYQRFLKLRGDPHAIGMGLCFGFFGCAVGTIYRS